MSTIHVLSEYFLSFVHEEMKTYLNTIKWNHYKFSFLNKTLFSTIIYKTINSYSQPRQNKIGSVLRLVLIRLNSFISNKVW